MTISLPAVTLDALEKLLKRVKIPPRPQVLIEVDQELANPTPDLIKIAASITQDVGLAAAVLHTINSPFFGRSRKIDSVQRAVQLLGARNIANIARAVILQHALEKGAMKLDRFWETATDVANISAYLAKELHIENPDENYTLGLFHDCGIAILAQKYDDYKETLKKGNSNYYQTLTDFEDERYGTNHAVVGYLMCRSWFLSDFIAEVVHGHHDLDELFKTGKEHALRNLLLAVLKAACNISHTYRRLSEDLEWDLIYEDVLVHLKLSEKEYDVIRHDIHGLLDSSASIYHSA